MFYDKKVYKVLKASSKNSIAQIIDTYKVINNSFFYADIQPVTDAIRAKVWGEDTEIIKNMWADVSLNVGELVAYNNVMYIIKKRIMWEDFSEYGLEVARVKEGI